MTSCESLRCLLIWFVFADCIDGFDLYRRDELLPNSEREEYLARKQSLPRFDGARNRVPPRTYHRRKHLHYEFETVIDGGWSEWSPWSECQATCGTGFRTSNRWCNNPTPENGGKDCEGEQIKKEPCEVKIHCPQNGRFGAWGPWRCSVTCGGGIATRHRLCDSPKPIYGGICVGNSSETWTVPCNAFTCPPTRRLSNSTRALLDAAKKNLKVQMFKFDEGTSTSRLTCATKQLLDALFWELKMDVQKALEWKKNGESWSEDKSRVDKGKFALDFKKAAYSDTGFYTCELDLLAGGRVILKAFSLIVLTSSVNLEVEMNKPFELDCNALVLASLYPHTRVTWLFNDTIFASFNDTPAALTNTLKFPYAMENMTGIWECKSYELDIDDDAVEKKDKSFLTRVKEKITGKSADDKDKKDHGPLNSAFRGAPGLREPPKIVPGQLWMTNRVHVKVLPAKTLLEQLKTPQFMGLCAGVVVLIVVVIVALVQGKFSAVMGTAEKNAQKFAQAQAEAAPLMDPNEVAGEAEAL